LLALFAIAAATGGPKPASDDAAAALSGTILQLFNHGLSAAALFHCVGILESRAGGQRGLNDFGGVRAAAPIFAGLCGIAMFSSLGLPGLNGFIGEFLIFRGVFGLVPWGGRDRLPGPPRDRDFPPHLLAAGLPWSARRRGGRRIF
jgi:NADH-quinone oxidoreductase subunit M